MNTAERYFDNAATTPVDERVVREMLPFFGGAFGNSESIHSVGQQARHAVEVARERVAALVGAETPEQIVFTSGSTESCNWVIRVFEEGYVSPWEHSAVREPAAAKRHRVLSNRGLEPQMPDDVADDTLVSLMWVNNEIGTIWNPRLHRPANGKFFSDATQALGKVPIDTDAVDFMAFSAHKLYGPKGVGALYLREGIGRPSQLGGDHEWGLRAGTLNVPGIVGFGAACAIAEQEMEAERERVTVLRGVVLDKLSPLTGWRINGGEDVSPYILSMSFEGVEGEALVVDLDAKGFAISAGSACSSRSTEPSHVLMALNPNDPWRRGTIRISFGRFNTQESAADLGANLLLSMQKLRTMR